jgi:hypothetical protein
VLLHHEALATGRDLRRRRVDLVVKVIAAAAQRLEPVDDCKQNTSSVELPVWK